VKILAPVKRVCDPDLGIDAAAATSYPKLGLLAKRSGSVVFVESVDQRIDKLHNVAKLI
jgi:hypothetical protein